MAIPIIDLTSSVLGYPQWQAFQYQPYAVTDSAITAWTCSTLPAGITVDAATGLFSADGSTPAGVYVIGLGCVNGSGASATVKVTIGIGPAIYSNPGTLGANVYVDGESGEVTTDIASGLQIKAGDDVLLYVQFRKGATNIDYGTLTELKLTLKEFEPDASIMVGDEFAKVGSGASTNYILYVQAVSSSLAAALSSYEADTGTLFTATAELEWKQPNDTTVGPNPMRRTSRLFPVTVVRNLTP